VIARFRRRQELQFFGALGKAAPGLTTAWWTLLVLRGVLPPLFAVSTGTVVAAVEGGDSLTGPLTFVGLTFIAFQLLPPLHEAVSANLGSRAAAWLNDRLVTACVAPPGLAHLEDPRLTNDLTMARDFDLGITGPPFSIAMGFIASGLVQMVGGLAAAAVLFGYSWWAPIVLVVGWGATHWMLRESGVWRDRNTDEVRTAQRHADYAYRLAVDPPAAKELRLFGLTDWVVERFTARRHHLHRLQWEATRLRERPVLGCLLVVLAANLVVFWSVADSVVDGRTSLAVTVVFLQTAFGAGAIAFGGLNWALDGAAAPTAAVLRLEAAMAPVGALSTSGTRSAADMPRRSIEARGLSFAYGDGSHPVLDDLDLSIPAGTSLAIVGRNGAGKTTLAKLLCRLYDPQRGAIEVDGVDLRDLELGSWRSQVTAVFQDFTRYERSLRDNVAPKGAPDEVVLAALRDAGAHGLGDLDTILARGYAGGTDLSGGQWQRVALARALCAVRQGARVVLLDEPTAQLDVRGEAEIFERVLAATRHCTTILVSHRFSTVRQVDRICVLDAGRVVELGSHDELMALDGGHYRTMFELQAARFADGEPWFDEHGEEVAHESLT